MLFRSALISLFIAFPYKNSSWYGSRFSYKLQISFLMLKSQNSNCLGTVRFDFKGKISVKTDKRKNLNRGRVRAF